MTKIIDLDVVVGKPKEVKLGGKIYKVPADLPVELYLKVNSFSGDETEKDVIESLYDDLLDLFRVHQPELEALPLGLVQIMRAIPLIYSAEVEDESESAPRPTRSRGKGATTRSRRTTR